MHNDCLISGQFTHLGFARFGHRAHAGAGTGALGAGMGLIACSLPNFGFKQPGWNVTAPVQHTPNIDVIGSLQIENHMRVGREKPGCQSR